MTNNSVFFRKLDVVIFYLFGLVAAWFTFGGSIVLLVLTLGGAAALTLIVSREMKTDIFG
jgi:hypothetical protein